MKKGLIKLKKVGKSGVEIVPIKEPGQSKYHSLCGYRKSEGFERPKHVYQLRDGSIEIWGRDSGAEKSISKWDLPPPLDTVFLYGDLLAVHKKANKIVAIGREEWEQVYEELFGGFEDLDGSEEEQSEDELATIPSEDLTAAGYLKDGFVVDDDTIVEEEYE